MNKQFVTYEIALKLKELGFNNTSKLFDYQFFYRNGDNFVMGNDGALNIWNYYGDNLILAPLWQQVIDWFRNRYNLLIDSPKLDVWNIGKWSVKITSIDKSIVLEEHVGQPYWRIYRCFRTYEEAREQAILKAIELCKQKS